MNRTAIALLALGLMTASLGCSKKQGGAQSETPSSTASASAAAPHAVQPARPPAAPPPETAEDAAKRAEFEREKQYVAHLPSGALDNFSKCVAEKQVVMYGAFWCPHCKEQKELFGDAFRDINYVECGVQGDPRGQTPACKMMMIKKYPTWTFPNGERKESVLTLQELSQNTGCKLP
jgi:thiol-disulfide isomerase/thioredoxin